MDRRHFLAGSLIAAAGAPNLHAAAERASGPGDLLKRKIPTTGEMIPAIGLGTSGPFEVGTDDSARAPLRDVLRAFFDSGATLIDTSPMYSTAETVLGELLDPDQQAKAFIATKVWTPNSGRASGQKGVEQMQRSAGLLKHPRVELMQVHNLVEVETQLNTLRGWKADGTIKYLGVTHYTTASYPDLIALIEKENLDFAQFNYSVVTREAEKKLLPLCADKGVAVIINRAFEDGSLFTQVQGKALPPWAVEFGAQSWAQVFLKFVLSTPAVTCVIPATGKVRNLEDNLGAGLGKLPDAKQRARIIAAVV